MIALVVERAVQNRGLVFALAAVLGLWGWWAIGRSRLDALPDLSDRQVIVVSEWEGRSPDLVEAQVTYPIVSKLVGAPGVRVVRGQSFFGVSFVYVIFEDGTDLYWARSRTLETLAGLGAELPDDAEVVLGPDATGVGWVFQYALVDETGGTDLGQLRSLQDWHLKYLLESVPGVAEVASVGGFVVQYQVELDPVRLLAHNLQVHQVIDAVRRSSNDVGGRIVELGSTEYMVRGRGYVRSIEDLRQIVLRGAAGQPVRLGDIADVKIGAEPRRGLAELDGKGETVGGIVIARDGENALAVVDRVKARIAEVSGSLPPGVRIVPVYDRSDLIHRAIRTLGWSLGEELFVVALFVILFLRHLRSALVPVISLPLAVLASFVPIWALGLSVNIMSLSGIIIAVGAMVDAAVIFVENAHKRLEDAPSDLDEPGRRRLLTAAFQEVGPSIFTSLLVLTVSFLPVFALESEEARLFEPLAFGKTFAMFFAAVLAVTLVPALGVTLIRGRIRAERDHPVSRALHAAYGPVLRAVLARPRWVLAGGVAAVVTTAPVYLRLGSESMPPLNEGAILYMPTSLPGLSITEAARVLQIQDRVLRSFPEVTSVFGKIGRAETATDPAPLSMAETTVLLAPPETWREVPARRWHSGLPALLSRPLALVWPERRQLTWDDLIAEMDRALQVPGMPPIWWMPVQTRTQMTASGIRSNLGVKVFGADRADIERVSLDIESRLRGVPGARSVFAERLQGGYYLDYEIDRAQVARYGLAIEDVEDIIETAIGGRPIARTVEGRERYAIVVQYLRGLRDSASALERVLVPLPVGRPESGAMADDVAAAPVPHVPITAVTRLRYDTGPHMLQTEDGYPYGVVFVDVEDADYEGFVDRAKAAIAAVDLPPGVRLEWDGQYASIVRTRDRLKLIVPLTLGIVAAILYANFRSWRHTAIVLLAVPFSLVGAVWLLWALGFNLSVAVWVGMIALAGIDAETGVVMLLYLDLAHDRARASGTLRTEADLREVIYEGAVRRVRPKVMTVFTDVVGLMPVMWAASTDAGADIAKRMAAPIVGGLCTSFLLELTIYPAIYFLWKRGQLQSTEPPDGSSGNIPQVTAQSGE
ncbi:MAG: efflux RND transporter permease subunit [Myxococcota bacterium]